MMGSQILSLHRRLKLGRHWQFLFGHYDLFSFTEDGPSLVSRR